MPEFKLTAGDVFRATKAFAEAVGDASVTGKKVQYEGIVTVTVPSNPREESYEEKRHSFKAVGSDAVYSCSAKYKMSDLAKLF